jgi:hypothetical protein
MSTKKKNVEKPETTLVPLFEYDERDDYFYSNEFTPITISTVDNRVVISMSREEALELYTTFVEKQKESTGFDKFLGVGYTLQRLLNKYFVSGTAVSSDY